MADLTETNGKKKLIIEEGDEEIIIKNKNKGGNPFFYLYSA